MAAESTQCESLASVRYIEEAKKEMFARSEIAVLVVQCIDGRRRIGGDIVI